MYIRDHRRRKGFSPKLQKIWLGPAAVTVYLGPVLYKVQEKKGPRILHHDQLKPYCGAEIPLWVSRFRATMEAPAAEASLKQTTTGTPERIPPPSPGDTATEQGTREEQHVVNEPRKGGPTIAGVEAHKFF